ncbi:hypothetical protein HO173_005913 [Letharia columbiana]|uniref:CobW/HypB/UreG nucleotide-binding domain-containing protein n=1 Tax=Letharia columbiana TaxID=112416 RepID=A0A8H6FVY4_9LECA|nr:uncharacterized protein HO173_005913 [Letharia columbiana]KAF6235718.1 hypothetical protein HO173_005913 [Letharia columbiana]
MPPIPVTIVTGFLGSGKTTLILNLIPQLPKTYKLALLKNEFGDVAVDSQLASSSAIGGVQELLNGCICCNLVGQLGDALDTLRKDVHPDRIIIETSGSAFPATLAMEVNRLGRETGYYALDGVIVVIDVENWKGYEDTSYTAKMQARYTDLIVFNKWELVPERRYEDCLDRVGDLELQVATVRSERGRVDQSVLLGLDSAFAKMLDPLSNTHDDHDHDHAKDHQSEVEVISVTLSSEDIMHHGVNLDSLETFLLSTPKDEVYRIKAIVKASRPPASSGGDVEPAVIHQGQTSAKYILNWAFGRWTFTPMSSAIQSSSALSSRNSRSGSIVEMPEGLEIDPLVRMTVILARGEADKWKKRIETQGHIESENEDGKARLQVTKILL